MLAVVVWQRFSATKVHPSFLSKAPYGISNGVVDVLLGTLRSPAAKPERA